MLQALIVTGLGPISALSCSRNLSGERCEMMCMQCSAWAARLDNAEQLFHPIPIPRRGHRELGDFRP